MLALLSGILVRTLFVPSSPLCVLIYHHVVTTASDCVDCAVSLCTFCVYWDVRYLNCLSTAAGTILIINKDLITLMGLAP